MKNLVLSSRVHLLLAISAALLGFESRTFAQEGQGVFITQSAARLSKLVDKGNKDKFNLQNNTFSIGGGWLKKGDAWVGLYTVQLEQGKSYRFLAAGDDDAKDVDLRLMDLKGKMEYAVDDRDDAEAVVNFTPKMSGRYLVQIRLYSSRKDFDAVCLSVVMQK